MPLTDEQILELKNQLRQQIQQLPADKKAVAEAQIESLSPEALEEMLQQQSRQGSKGENKGIFRRVIDGDVPSVKVAENRLAAAFMDINPISRGHLIVLPKKAVEDAKKIPTAAFTLAKKLAARILSKLKATSTEIQTENKFNESYINVIPSYETPVNINSQRNKATMEELEEIAKLLRVKPRKKAVKVIKIEKPVQQNGLTKPRRIP
jgi:histidine triad (HIT) family protein